ncbi:hypothetical protein [Paenibacillus medicaginis]|uniref:Uncharacterized protein n=1 Tax=Paenibacillus medicaginis TaxID=1470560 RepID=A0ABV5C0K7_9BACL
MKEIQKRIDELRGFYDRICENPLSVDLEVLPASIDWLVGEIKQLKALLPEEQTYVAV